MKKPNPTHVELARRLLASEVHSLPDPADAAAKMYERILVHFSPIIGAAGVHALFARSVKLTKHEHPFLDQFIAGSVLPSLEERENPVERLRVCLQNQEPLKTFAPAEALFAHLFSLLAGFIGDRLTTQLVDSAWPELSESGKSTRKS